MKTLGNIIWLILNGLWLAIAYAILGLIVCVFVVTIPFGLQLFKLAGYALWPFGRVVVKSPDAGAASVLGNVIWLIPGCFLALGHLLAAFANLLACVFIITIPICVPFAVANLKMVGMAIWPFGRQIVNSSRLAVVPVGAIAVPTAVKR